MMMEQDLFNNLPSEVIADILFRLPLRAVATSKCVCKSWLDLLKKDEFVKSHFSRSPATLSVLLPGKNSSQCTLYELKDAEIDVESSHDHRYIRLTKLDFPHEVSVLGSANGLLLLVNYSDPLYVWNPISREYIELHCPAKIFTPQDENIRIVYGFGASKISGQYKVVRNIGKSDCYVYTLGTRSWRRVKAAGVSFDCGYSTPFVFLYGNLHWLVLDSDDNSWISCFDLETECFSTFPTSPAHQGLHCMESKLCALSDCLCLCDQTSLWWCTIDIWLMKEYGVGKSWTKEYVINLNPDFDTIALETVTPIKVFKDGDILMQWGEEQLFYYSNKEKTTHEFSWGLFDMHPYNFPELITPSFLSLKSFGVLANVISLGKIDG